MSDEAGSSFALRRSRAARTGWRRVPVRPFLAQTLPMIVRAGCVFKSLEHGALLSASGRCALSPELAEFPLQGPEVADARSDVPDVFVQHAVHGRAVVRPRIPELQQDADFIQRHVKTTAMPDEGQSLEVIRSIASVVCRPCVAARAANPRVRSTGSFPPGFPRPPQFTDLQIRSSFVQPLDLVAATDLPIGP